MLEVRGLAKRFGAAALLDAVDLRLAPREWVAVVGESGSGKSTLLHLVAGIERPDAGTIVRGGRAIDPDDDDALALWRRREVGFVFQAFHLLPYLSAAENVALPLALLGVAPAERLQRATEALERVGLAALGARRPGTLSGGEMQRVAIARALVHAPKLVLADEPTGNLDESSAAVVLDTLATAVRRTDAAVLMVTHSPLAAARADRVVRLEHGRLVP